MQTPTPPPSALVSPTSKRKRPLADQGPSISPSPSRLKTTNLPTRPLLEANDVAEGSPRTVVAGHLQSLDLEPDELHTSSEVSKLEFGMGKRKIDGTGLGRVGFAPQVLLPEGQNYGSEPVTPPSSSHGGPALLSTQDISFHPKHQPPPLAPPFEIPESPPTAPRAPDPLLANKSPPPPPTSSQSNPTSPLWWTDTEITGHNPSDPTDDGYGINGVGFVPTPAMATARAEKRRRQVREWKEREAKEARARRGQRRMRARRDVGVGTASLGHGPGEEGVGMEQESAAGIGEEKVGEGRRVRFSMEV